MTEQSRPAGSSWEKVPLGDPTVTTIVMGQSPDSATYNTKGVGLPFFQGKADFGLRHPVPSKWCSAPVRIAQTGDVLISVRAPVGDVNVAKDECCIGRGLAAIRAGERVASEFLFFQLLAERARLAALGSGAIFDAINKDTIATFDVLLPRLDEQRAIARVLEQIQDSIQARDRRISMLKALKAATLAKFFPEDISPPSNADPLGPRTMARIRDHFVVGNGSTPSRKNPEYWKGGRIPWITSGKVHETVIRRSEEYVTDVAKKECHLPLVPKGSVVVAITGQGKTLGNAARVDLDTTINQHLAYMRPKTAELSTDYLLAYLQTRYKDFRRIASAGGSTKGALTCGLLEAYPLPRCSSEVQAEIAATWHGLTERIRAAEEKKRHLQDLFAVALSGLMSGSLRVTPLLKG